MAHFTGDRRYFETALGKEYDYTQATGPYEYLLGALAGCFYSTLSSYERKSGWKNVDIEVIGIKRDGPSPRMLEHTLLDITVTGAEDRDEFERLVEKASSSCSIYCTLSAVSRMEWRITYKDD